jgi:hypothetical protein
MNDPNSSMVRLMGSISDRIPIVYVNMDYNKSPYEGLQAYEWGYIKEEVGCEVPPWRRSSAQRGQDNLRHTSWTGYTRHFTAESWVSSKHLAIWSSLHGVSR